MNRFKDKYRISSTRKKQWDYDGDGMYFITICTKNRTPYFGRIIDSNMQLSKIGKIAHACWMEIPEHFPFVELGEFIVMPDHIHGILTIHKNETKEIKPSGDVNNRFGPQSRNLASIIRGYKVGVTKFSRELQCSFGWQKSFHDVIILNAESYVAISKYIENNPMNWEQNVVKK
jgi:REP element-mobilizing transposase RayT